MSCAPSPNVRMSFSSDCVQSRLESFYSEAHQEAKFDDPEDSEQSIEAYRLFKQWETLFEELLQVFLTEQGVAESAFWQACRRCQDSEDEAAKEEVEALECALSAIDYRAWTRMMRRKGEEYDVAREDAHSMGFS